VHVEILVQNAAEAVAICLESAIPKMNWN